MKNQQRKVSLGFTTQEFEPGVHICQIFNEDDERHGALIDYLISGIKSGDKTACFTEQETEASLSEIFEEHGISFERVSKSGNFTLAGTNDIYFENGKFEPERMLRLLRQFYDDSISEKRAGARVIGEMSTDIENIPGGSRLMEYESKVSLLIKDYPITAVCQYDARLFDGSTILNILKVHPYMIIKGAVVHNPFYIKPEEYLSGN
jgi:hypothetical protein